MSCYSGLTSDRIMGSIVDDNVFQVYWTLLTYYSLRSHVHYCCTITIQAKHLLYILYRLPHYHHMSQGTTFPTRLHVCSVKTLFSLHICVGWSESLCSFWRHFGCMSIQRVPCEASDQTMWMWSCTGCTCNLVGNVVPQLKYHSHLHYNLCSTVSKSGF